MKNALLFLTLFTSATLLGQTEAEQLLHEELGATVARSLSFQNCSGEAGNLIFDRIILQPDYSTDFIRRANQQGINSSFFQKYTYSGPIPVDGQLDYQSLQESYQLIFFKDGPQALMAYQTIDFSTSIANTEVCVDRYWYQSNSKLLIDQLLDGELSDLAIRVYRSNTEISKQIATTASWNLTKSGDQLELIVKKGEEIIQQQLVNDTFLTGLRNWETRVRSLAEHPTKRRPGGLAETYTIGASDFFMEFSTRNTKAFEADNLQALLKLL